VQVAPSVKRWLTGTASDPSVRFRYWTEVEGASATAPRASRARAQIGKKGWAAKILDQQFPDGHWVTPAPMELYRPKYTATNWMMIVLADLGMTKRDRRIARLAELVLDRWSRREGKEGYPLSGFDGETCATGNAVRSLIRFGYLDHPTVQQSIDWLLRAQKTDGGWHCWPARRGTLDAWEGLAALAEIPDSARDERVRAAIERGAEFFLRRKLLVEGSTRYPPWYRIHYPNHYYYDILVGLRVLTRLGYAEDPRMGEAYRWLLRKRASDGRWATDAIHPDLDPEHGGYEMEGPVFSTWLERAGTPSRWVSVEALSVLARRG
jgi:hypothetical protein